MDEMKKVKNFLSKNKFHLNKKNIYFKNLISKNQIREYFTDLRKICVREKLIIVQSEKSKNILIYYLRLNKKFDFIFIKLCNYNYKAEVKFPSSYFRYFADYQKFGLFTILGPEGVGKSTLCNNISRLLVNAPFRFDSFHHTGEWKVKVRKQDAKVNKSSSRLLVSLVPLFLKNLINMVRGEFKYFDNLSKILFANYLKRKIILCDRYCYDRYVRWSNLKKPFLQKTSLFLLCYLMRKPSQCFLLIDTPVRIFKRKKVMPLWEIPKHIELLEKICKKFDVNFIKVNVKNFNEMELRNFVLEKIIFEKRNQIIDDYLS